jgi:hypothetical protein
MHLAYNNRRELGKIGACEAVVTALQAFGERDKEVAWQGCGAVWNLAYNDDNIGQLSFSWG